MPSTWHGRPPRLRPIHPCGSWQPTASCAPATALEAIYPDAAHVGGAESLPDGTGQDLVQAAARQLRNIPQGQEEEGLSLVLGYLAEAEHEVGGRFRR